MTTPKVLFRVHAVQRMVERGISLKNITQALQSGQIIEDYSAEMPEPSRLILGFRGEHSFHMVISEDQRANELTIITVYLPDPRRWTKDFTRRRA